LSSTVEQWDRVLLMMDEEIELGLGASRQREHLDKASFWTARKSSKD